MGKAFAATVTSIGVLVVNASPGLAATFSDGTFDLADWPGGICEYSYEGYAGGDVNVSQSPNGNPGPCLVIDGNAYAVGGGQYSKAHVAGAWFQRLAVYSPQTEGAIDSVSLSLDWRAVYESWEGSGSHFGGFALRQNDSIYALPIEGMWYDCPRTWTHWESLDLRASDFSLWLGSGSLDFSAKGSPIEFGLYLGCSAVAYPWDDYSMYELVAACDNWWVTVTPKPIELVSPLGFLNAGWNWFSLPVPPLQNAVSDIFSPEDPTNRLYRWDPVLKTVQLYPDDFTTLNCDESYTLLGDTDTRIHVQGFPTPPGYGVLVPSAGWMWIGFPKTGAIPFVGVTVHNRATNETRTAMEDYDASDPWLNWNWLYWNSALDTVQILGLAGADDDHARPWYGYRLWANVAELEVVYPEP